MKNKIKRALAGLLLAAVSITSVVGGSVAEVEAKTTKCKTEIKVGKKFYSYKYNKTINLIMCKGHTSQYKVDDDGRSKLEEGDRPYRIAFCKKASYIRIIPGTGGMGVKCFPEKHKVTITSSNPSVVSVKSKLTGSDKEEVYMEAKKCGTAIVTAKASCGNKFKIKITVKDHNYRTWEDGETYCKCCGKALRGVPNVTEDEIHQRILDIIQSDGGIYDSEIDEYEINRNLESLFWNASEYWTQRLIDEVWYCDDIGGFDFNRQEIKDYSKVRSGDIVYMKNEHWCMVVENLHDGTFIVTDNYRDGVCIDESNKIPYNSKARKSVYTLYRE